MTSKIDNTEDFIDSRDVIKRIDELEEDENLNKDKEQELKALKDLESQCQYGNFGYGTTLIHDNYFVKYAQEIAEDTGACDMNHRWPYNHIDWEGAAEELKMDYKSVDFDGETYWLGA
jgi:hypothetical protein